MRRWIGLAAFGLALCVATLGYMVGRARADGIPTMPSLWFGGTLTRGGVPVDGESHNFTVNLWNASTSGRTVCTETDAPGTMVSGGHWRIALDDSCVAAIHAAPDLWTEVLVDGTSFGRSKIGAVPFAVEAQYAANASGTLANQIVPSGAVMAFNLPTCPPGWSPMTAAVGQVIVGSGGSLSVGMTAGADLLTLTASQVPSHTHGVTDPGHTHFPFGGSYFLAAGVSGCVDTGGSNAGADFCHDIMAPLVRTGISIQPNDGGAPFDNRQASLALLYCQKD